jgi:hypothetical protein
MPHTATNRQQAGERWIEMYMTAAVRRERGSCL